MIDGFWNLPDSLCFLKTFFTMVSFQCFLYKPKKHTGLFDKLSWKTIWKLDSRFNKKRLKYCGFHETKWEKWDHCDMSPFFAIVILTEKYDMYSVSVLLRGSLFSELHLMKCQESRKKIEARKDNTKSIQIPGILPSWPAIVKEKYAPDSSRGFSIGFGIPDEAIFGRHHQLPPRQVIQTWYAEKRVSPSRQISRQYFNKESSSSSR